LHTAGVKLPPPDYDQLVGAVKRQCAAHNLQPTDAFLLKVTQLYEMIVVRHGLMLVGQPFSGKSAALKVLAGALGDLSDAGVAGPLFNRVQQVVINPKAVTMGQLYGKHMCLWLGTISAAQRMADVLVAPAQKVYSHQAGVCKMSVAL
jgi:dynein heavy chain